MKIITLKNRKEIGKKAALIVASAIKKNPNLVLGLSAGRTMIPLFKELVKSFHDGKISFSKTKSFNIDEYVGLNENDKESLRYFMNRNLFSKIDIKNENIYFLDGKAKNFNLECRKYDSMIKKFGIDLLILGIGRNGHIAFNEPGSSFKSVTRRVRLTETTRKDNAIFFHSKKVPENALTIGIKTIIKSRKIILLASGENKAYAIMKAIKSEVNEKLPASILQKHKNVIFILDKSAARLL